MPDLHAVDPQVPESHLDRLKSDPSAIPLLRHIRAHVLVALEDLAALELRVPEEEREVIGSQLLGAKGDLTNLIDRGED